MRDGLPYFYGSKRGGLRERMGFEKGEEGRAVSDRIFARSNSRSSLQLQACGMKPYYLALLSSLCMLAIFSCQKERPQNSSALPVAPDVSCTNLGVPCGSWGRYIYPGAAEMWEQAFRYHYSYNGSSPFQFALKSDTLRSYLPNGDDCCTGIRCYFGLQSPATSLFTVPSALCLILVPFNQNGDTVTAVDSSVIMLIDTVSSVRIPIAAARQYVQNWQNHYTLEPNLMVRVYAYNFSAATLRGMVAIADSTPIENNGGDGLVRFLLGYHTIDPHDSGYCWIPQSLPPDSGDYAVVPPMCPPKDSLMYGNTVLNLIVAANRAGQLQRSSDFARPCPRFCGKSLLYFSIKSEWKRY